MKDYDVDYEDIVLWSEYAAQPLKFLNARAECDRIMRCKKKPTMEQLQAFRENYKIRWLSDNSFEVLQCSL